MEYVAAHKSLKDAIAFGQKYGFQVTSEEDPDGSKHAAAFGAQLLALSEACQAGRYRVRIEDDTEPADLSWDDTGETRAHLESGHFVNVYGCLDRWDGERWIQVDGVGQVIDIREDVGRIVWCYAADWIREDNAEPAPAPEDNDACDYLPDIPGHPFAGVSVQSSATAPDGIVFFALAGGDCAGQ